MFISKFINLQSLFNYFFLNWFKLDFHLKAEIMNYFSNYLKDTLDQWFLLESLNSETYIITNWNLFICFDKKHILSDQEFLEFTYINFSY